MILVDRLQLEYNENEIKPNFKYLTKYYNRQRPKCEKCGKLYLDEEVKVVDKLCHNWSCLKCRPRLKYILFCEIINNILSFELDKHFIITFKGKDLREQIDFWGSYKFMSEQWKLLHQCIKRKYGYIDFILLPRAQRSGYCHYHIITNAFIDWNWLNKKRKKYNIGYVSIKRNKSVADYLQTDYFKDHEYYIPSNIKHYRSSRSIILKNYKPRKVENFDINKSFDEIKNFVKNKYFIDLDFLDDYIIPKITKNFYKNLETDEENLYEETAQEMLKKIIHNNELHFAYPSNV